MSLTDFTKDMAVIAALDDEPNDVGGLTSAQLKAKFDEGGGALKSYINDVLIPELEERGVLEILRTKDESVKYIRLNSDGAIEVSADNITWEATASSGHVIIDRDGKTLPQRSRMRFSNCEVSDDGVMTVITGVKGDKGDKGDTGNTGPQGPQGLKGDIGNAVIPTVDQVTGLMSFTVGEPGAVPAPVYVRGPQGVQGVRGDKGDPGEQGIQGLQGIQGVQGLKGDTGEKGEAGPQGLQGLQGPKGDAGARGLMGEQGPVGAVGPQGIQGPAGTQGPQGPRGDKGDKGDKGDTGPQGLKGEKGDPGEQGVQGARGAQGIQGVAGGQGPQGLQGPKGERGLDGRSFEIQDIYPTLAQLKTAFPTGTDGAFQVSANMELYIWSEANLGWQSIGALEGPQGPQGIQGVQGAQGPQGEPGAQGPQGIQGPKGDVGAQGPKGDKGDKGDTGAQGPQGEAGPKGPQGIQGPKGEQGLPGEQGIQGPKGDTGPQGAQGLTGAKGDKGDTGAQGPQGVQGAQGVQGPAGEQGIQGPAGKTAYQSALAGGFSGDEAAFNRELSQVGNKAAKKIPAASGNLAILDANGDLGDSGKESSDFASSAHKHKKSEITDFPSAMTPSAHKASHKTGGTDALTPADIGALPVQTGARGQLLGFTAENTVGAVNTPGGFLVQETAPADTGLLWIDTTADTGGLKYYNGTEWVHVPVAYV